MKIVHVVVSDSDGGAARAAFRINTAINSLGDTNYISNMLVLDKSTSDKTVYPLLDSRNKRIIYKIKKKLNGRSLNKYNNSTFFSNDLHGINICDESLIKDADIINLHWINNAMLSYKTLEKLISLKKPIVWTLHDMYPFTGGCHYDEGCGKYKNICGSCKVLKSEVEKDLAYEIQQRKKRIFSQMNVSIVGCSNWITDCAKESTILGDKKCINIPNAINHNIFKPVDKSFSRQVLNIDTNKKVILFGAMSADSDERKGYKYLVSALKQIDSSEYKIVVFGNENDNKEISNEFDITYIGKVQDDYTLTLIYSSADVFVAPSVQENLANTVMESLACGTPVVAFDIGGMKDMIKHKANGYLAVPFNTDDLTSGIKWCAQNREILTNNARSHVIDNYRYDIVSKKYIDFYNSLI